MAEEAKISKYKQKIFITENNLRIVSWQSKDK